MKWFGCWKLIALGVCSRRMVGVWADSDPFVRSIGFDQKDAVLVLVIAFESRGQDAMKFDVFAMAGE